MRSPEIAIRLAFGANSGGVLKIVLRQALTTARIGVVLGSPLAIVVGLLIQTEVFGVGGVDVGARGGSAVLLVASVLLASAIPARRAARVDPMVVLRKE
jgi:ABC-type antimicrobial peptide transport system permease subunit